MEAEGINETESGMQTDTVKRNEAAVPSHHSPTSAAAAAAAATDAAAAAAAEAAVAAAVAAAARAEEAIFGDVCAICQEDVALRGKIDSCAHLFCLPCVKRWAKIETRRG